MFGMIKISEVAFLTHINQLKSVQAGLASIDATFYDYKSKSTVLDLYHNQFDALAGLITSYANFLSKDIELMRQGGATLLEMDAQLGYQLGQLKP